MREYKARIVDRILQDKLEAKGAVVIEGPKWCGKTTTAMQVAGSVLRMDEPSKRESNIQMSQIAPERLLQGETPRLVDEWIAGEKWGSSFLPDRRFRLNRRKLRIREPDVSLG